MVQLDSIAQSCSQGMYMNLLLFYQHVHVLLMCFHSFMGMGLLQSKNPRSALSPVSSGCPAEEETPESRVGEGAAAGRTQLPDGSSGSLNRGIHALYQWCSLRGHDHHWGSKPATMKSGMTDDI